MKQKQETDVVDIKALTRRDFLKKTGKAAGAAAAVYMIPTMISATAQPAYAAGTIPDSPVNEQTLQQQLLASTQQWQGAVLATFNAQTPLTPFTQQFERLAPSNQLTGTNTTRQEDVDIADAIAAATAQLVSTPNVATAIDARDSIVTLIAAEPAGHYSLGDVAYLGSLSDPTKWTHRDFDGDGVISQADVDLWNLLITAWGG